MNDTTSYVCGALWRSITETWAIEPSWPSETKKSTAPSRITQGKSNPIPMMSPPTSLGERQISRRLHRAAIADFTKAIELKPNNDSAYTKRGAAHYEKAEYDRAIPTSPRPLRSTRGQPLPIATWAGPTRR